MHKRRLISLPTNLMEVPPPPIPIPTQVLFPKHGVHQSERVIEQWAWSMEQLFGKWLKRERKNER